MAYQALYRKWRPDNFGDVKGQDHIVTTLRNQVTSSHIGHAYLLNGTRGTGKTTIAKIFAKAINCENPLPDGSPCNECHICTAINEQRYPFVHEIDAASNNGVENVRDIINNIVYSPTEGKYIVYIIDEAHMLSTSAFNALLKTLEEPPSYAVFILATTDPEKLPITILSRCQRYDFKRITIETITDRLRELMVNEGINVTDDALKYVARAADGSMRDALSLLDQCISFYLGQELDLDKVCEVLGAVNIEVLSKLFNNITDSDVGNLMNYIEQLVMEGREMTSLVNDFVSYLRNLLVTKESPDVTELKELPKEQYDIISGDSAKVDLETLIRYIRVCSDLSNKLKTSTQKRVDVEIAFIKLAKPQMESDIDSLHSRIVELEKEIEELKGAIAGGGVVITPAHAKEAVSNEEEHITLKEAIKDIPQADQATIEQLVRNYAEFRERLNAVDPVVNQTLNVAKLSVSDNPGEIRLIFGVKTAMITAENNKATLLKVLKDFTKRDIKVAFVQGSFDDPSKRYQDLIKCEIEEQ